MNSKFYIVTFIVAGLCMTKDHLLNAAEQEDTCDLKLVLDIMKSNTDVISQQVTTAGSTIYQNCINAKSKIQRLVETKTVSKVLNVTEATLTSLLKSGSCNDSAKHFDVLHARITEQYKECVTQAKSNQNLLQSRGNLTDKWIDSIKVLTGRVLEKCAINYVDRGCAELQSCCLGVVGHLTYKIIDTVKNQTNAVSEIISKQTSCFENVTETALNIEQLIHDDIVNCSLLEDEAKKALTDEETAVKEFAEEMFKADGFESITKSFAHEVLDIGLKDPIITTEDKTSEGGNKTESATRATSKKKH